MKLKPEIVRIIILVTLVTAFWCLIHHRYSVRDWQVPTKYDGDSLFVLAWSKAAMDGEFHPIIPKLNKYLGAPFVANWNDFPLSEDLIFWVTGMFARVIGLGAAINLSFLVACVLAAVSFYLVGRYLRWRWEWCSMGGIAFALSNFVFFRDIPHIFYTHYWHLPLYLLVCWWAGSKRGLTFSGWRYPFAALVAVITGFLSVYYTNFFVQFLVLATLSQVVRRSDRSKILAPASIVAIAIGVFLLASLDTFIYSFQHGINPNALLRNYAQVEHHSLHPIELFIPRLSRWPVLQGLERHYIISVAGEHALSEVVYLGIVGSVGLVLMLGAAGVNFMKRPVLPPFAPALQAIWIIAYGMVSGLNCLGALAGFPLFHGMNRVSIMVLALSLFSVVRALSRLSRAWPRLISFGVSGAMVILALADHPPNVTKKEIQQTRTLVEADRTFALKMERQLPRGAMVFQLPVLDFPEAGLIRRMGLYESFRPYLYTRELRYSHGTCKGRDSDSWQRQVQNLPPQEMVATLEHYGFAAICINHKAYADNGAQWIDKFRSVGRGRILQDTTAELTCVYLQADAKPVLPELLTDFRKGWHQTGTNEQGISSVWSKGNAMVTIENLSGETLVRYLSFDVATFVPRNVGASLGGTILWSGQLGRGSWLKARDLVLTLPSGKTDIQFATDAPADRAGGYDARRVAFLISDFRLKKEPETTSGKLPVR